MAAKLTIRDATPADVEHVAANLRDADLLELTAAHGMVPVEDLISLSADTSPMCWTALLDDVPVCVFGVTDMLPGVGSPWLVATDDWDKLSPHHVWRVCFEHIRAMRREYDLLMNYIYEKNIVSIGWLSKLGFRIGDAPVPYGKYGEPFYLFWMSGVSDV